MIRLIALVAGLLVSTSKLSAAPFTECPAKAFLVQDTTARLHGVNLATGLEQLAVSGLPNIDFFVGDVSPARFRITSSRGCKPRGGFGDETQARALRSDSRSQGDRTRRDRLHGEQWHRRCVAIRET